MRADEYHAEIRRLRANLVDLQAGSDRVILEQEKQGFDSGCVSVCVCACVRARVCLRAFVCFIFFLCVCACVCAQEMRASCDSVIRSRRSKVWMRGVCVGFGAHATTCAFLCQRLCLWLCPRLSVAVFSMSASVSVGIIFCVRVCTYFYLCLCLCL